MEMKFFPQQSKGEREVSKITYKVQSSSNMLVLGNLLPRTGYSLLVSKEFDKENTLENVFHVMHIQTKP